MRPLTPEAPKAEGTRVALEWLKEDCVSHPRDSVGSLADTLEELLQHRQLEAQQRYLGKVRAPG